jgi:hypothetical protein
MSSRSIFGWSYPPGCSGPPDDDYREPVVLRCKHCKAFIGGAHKTEPWECSYQCNGEDSDGMCGGPSGIHKPHKDIMDDGQYDIYTCKRCGKETKI